jgi:hypothetical protein
MQFKAEGEEPFVPYIDDNSEGPILLGGIVCIPMATALAHIHSDEGFAISADGMMTRRRADGGLEIASEIEQKIFHLPGSDRVAACSFAGTVTLDSDDSTRVAFDFIAETLKAAQNLESKPMKDANDFAGQIGDLVQKRLETARRSEDFRRPLGWKQGLRICIDGYFNAQPSRAVVEFHHIKQESAHKVHLHHLLWHPAWLSGSIEVTRLLFDSDDPRFSQYRTHACKRVAARDAHPEIRVTLSDAIEAGRKFIEACSSAIAREIDDENCRGIGGHIHIATITPKAGFDWAVPPSQSPVVKM